MATVTAARRPPALLPFLLDNLVWAILAAILLVCSVTIEHFFQIGIFINIAQHATFVGLLAVGLSFCIIAGHMDLSIESVMAFAAMLASWFTATRGSTLGFHLNTWLVLLIVLKIVLDLYLHRRANLPPDPARPAEAPEARP